MKAWPTDRIGDACTIFSGGTPSKANPNYWRGAIPWVTAKDLKADRICDAELHITQQACDESATKIAPAGALLILVRGMGLANGMQIGEVTSPVAFNQDIRAVIPPARIESRFLLLALRHCLANDGAGVLSSAAHGTLKIDSDALRQVAVPVPPLPEQRRIVAILDEAFEGIATAKAHAEKNLRNAREVFSAVLACFFPSSRAEVTLVELADSISDGDHAPPPKAKDGVPFITISNIDKATRQIDFADTFLVPRSYFDGLKAHRRPVAGDVLYTVTGSFGIPVFVTGEQEFCFQRHIGLIRPKPTVDAGWLTYALLSPMAFAQADQRATGTAQRTVSLSVLRDLRLPRLPAEEQRRVAAEIATHESRTRELEDCLARKLAALDELKQSLLHQAFSGQL